MGRLSAKPMAVIDWGGIQDQVLFRGRSAQAKQGNVGKIKGLKNKVSRIKI
jgi:hypothetical protein